MKPSGAVMSVLGPGSKLRRSFRRFGVFEEEQEAVQVGQHHDHSHHDHKHHDPSTMTLAS